MRAPARAACSVPELVEEHTGRAPGQQPGGVRGGPAVTDQQQGGHGGEPRAAPVAG
ncbi:hypothetical protein [Nocardioides convexus]|uniref:hypothetical protein n=1 Tax=Nocardioides convexus TaxID=2712224 RepID=UPI0024189124|nr:hypothetical protein [Nocardioides convexus]